MFENIDLNRIIWSIGSYGLPQPYYKMEIPSVKAIIDSEVNDPEYEEFVRKMGIEQVEKIMKAAGEKGTVMHTFIENFLLKYNECKNISDALIHTQDESLRILNKDKISEDKIEQGRNLFYKFYYSNYPNVFKDLIKIEMGVYSNKLFYRGKLDIFYKDRIFGLAITDFKSSSAKIKKGTIKELKYKLQIGGYALAVDEMYESKGIEVNTGSILCMTKDHDKPQDINCSGKELKKYKEEFKTLVINYHIKNKDKYSLKKQ